MKKIATAILNVIALMCLVAGLAFIVLTIVTQPAHAAGTTARLTWTLATARIDDSPLPASQIRETLIEWRRVAGGPVVGTLRVPAPATTVDVPGLVCGDFVFQAFTVATDNSQSGASNTANYQTEIACVPKPPTGLSAS